MKHHYRDIRNRINEAPKWWDEAGVPRYCEFSPEETNFIYASEAVLLLIACQSCGKQFNVAMTADAIRNYFDKIPPLHEQIKRGEIHYGDPPNIECCPSGPTMNSIPIKVLEYWYRDMVDWKRDSRYEIAIEDE